MSRFDGSKDPAVNVTTWFLLVVAILSVLTRLGTKFWIFRKFTSNDYLIIVSLIFCIAESIAVSISVANGYGYHFAAIAKEQRDAVAKSLYSASILYITSLYFSKISLTTFIRNLTPVSGDHSLARILQGVITVWGVVALFGTAFECRTPRTWDYWGGRCINLMAWYYYVAVANIATDILIITQALLLIARVHATVKKRFVFASIFLSRILVILPTISEIILLRDIAHSSDATYEYCETTIMRQIIQCLSIMTACWGQLKPFLEWLKSNGLRINGVEYSTAKASHSTSHPRSGPRDGGYELEPIKSRNQTTVSASRDWEVDSQSSEAHIIRETRTWAVTDGRWSEYGPAGGVDAH